MSRFLSSIALPLEGLGWFRRGLGLLCVLDSLLRLPTAAFYLSDIGVLPRSNYFGFFESSWAWSLYLVSGWPEAAWVLLLLTAGLGVAQVLGRSHQVGRLALWFLLVSVQNRNPAVVDSGDTLLRMLLFWDIFLPEQSESKGFVRSPFTLGLQFQLTLVLLWLAWDFRPKAWVLASQWSNLEFPLWLPGLVMFSAGSLLSALWIRRWRRGLVVLSGLGWLAIAYFLQELWPGTLLFASLALLEVDGGSSQERVEGSRFSWALLLGVVVLALGGRATQPLMAGMGLGQNWNSFSPSAEEVVVELVARKSGGGAPLWYLSSDSSRRERLYAQAVWRDSAWAAALPRALRESVGLTDVELWLKSERLHPDYKLGAVEVELLSPSPVTTRTRRVVKL